MIISYFAYFRIFVFILHMYFLTYISFQLNCVHSHRNLLMLTCYSSELAYFKPCNLKILDLL